MIVVGRDLFSHRLAELLACPYRQFKHEYHPDGEPAPRIGAEYHEIKGEHVVLVLRGKQRPDYSQVSRNLHNHSRELDNLAFIFEAARVDVVMPYFWLARQDVDPRNDPNPDKRERDKGKDIGCEYLARDLKAHGASRVITFNPHFWRTDEDVANKGIIEHQQRGSARISVLHNYGAIKNAAGIVREGIDLYSISGVPALARSARERQYNRPLIVGPDLSATPLGIEFAQLLGIDGVSLPKTRVNGEEVKHSTSFDAEGRDVLVIDDAISTMGTIGSCLDNIRNAGHIDVNGVHGVFPEKGHERAKEWGGRKIRRIVTTDTIENDYGTASVLPDLAELFLNE